MSNHNPYHNDYSTSMPYEYNTANPYGSNPYGAPAAPPAGPDIYKTDPYEAPTAPPYEPPPMRPPETPFQAEPVADEPSSPPSAPIGTSHTKQRTRAAKYIDIRTERDKLTAEQQGRVDRSRAALEATLKAREAEVEMKAKAAAAEAVTRAYPVLPSDVPAPPDPSKLRLLYQAPKLSSTDPLTPIAGLTMFALHLLVTGCIVFGGLIVVGPPLIFGFGLSPLRFAIGSGVLIVVITPIGGTAAMAARIVAATIGTPDPIRQIGVALAFGWVVAIIAAIPVFLLCMHVLEIYSVFPLFGTAAAVYVLQAVVVGVGSVVRLVIRLILYRASLSAYIAMMRAEKRALILAKHLCFMALGGVGVAGTVAGITAFVCGVILGAHFYIIPITSGLGFVAFMPMYGLYHVYQWSKRRRL